MRMSRSFTTLMLVQLLLCFTPLVSGEEQESHRDLGAIRYHLTACGTSGRLGPSSDQQCIEYYQNQDSSVARDDFILEQTTPFFRGGQLIKLSRTTTYNITVVGATGRKGLCNPLYGRGVVIRAQTVLDENFQMIVMVGQRGQGPCEFTEPREDSFCSSLPQNNVTQCNMTWWDYVQSIAGYTAGLDVYRHTGGGGGGGASMIRLENEGGLQVFPLIVAGGGGGGAAVLDLNFVNTVNFTHAINATEVEIYQEFVDGKREVFDLVLSERQDQRGFIAPLLADDRTAGAGGGYVTGSEDARRVDGGQFIFEDIFGEGGTDCDTSSFVPTTFTAEVGGFGAGGGGCGGGGGGGGQTGGAIVGAGNLVPGGGGYSFGQEGVKILEYDWNNDGDGYVDIVPADCGCVYECVVYEEEDQFECHCPNETKLAPDLSDCYHTTTRQVEHADWDIDIGGGYEFTLVKFGNATSLFSISATLTIDIPYGVSGSGETVMNMISSQVTSDTVCAIAFVGTDEDIVLLSTQTQSDRNMLTTLSRIRINFTEGSLNVSEPTDFLPSSVLVTGAILISQGDCFIQNELSMNISILESSDAAGSGEIFGYPNLRDEILGNTQSTVSILMQILHRETEEKSTVNTNTTEFKTQEVIIASAVVGAAAIVVTATLFCLCCCYGKHKKKMKHRKRFFHVQVPSSATSSLTINAVYISHREITSNLSHCYHKYSVSSHLVRERRCTGSLRPATESCTHFGKVGGGGESSIVVPSVDHFCNFNRHRSKSTFNDPGWQYPRRQLVYMGELGEGQFGKVLLMKAQQGIAGVQGEIAVAVKTLTSRDPEMVTKFIKEAELMKKFTHPNIVSLLGMSTNDVMDDENAPLMILEYMSHGDLHAFLERNRPNSQTQDMQLVEAHFIHFATDVARALVFLTELNYVHRDIAARNCLVESGLKIKIADFGLARKLNAQNYFAIESDGVLPIRTMAPECFLTGHFTAASDVWSYGVLLWEMVSYGAIPLPGLSSHEITERAQSGKLQHVIPAECPPALSSLITQSHNHDPDRRPAFTDILESLTAACKTAPLGSPECYNVA